MVKIDKTATELKGMTLALVDGKNIIALGKLDAVDHKTDKGEADPNNLTLHFVQGSKWVGDIVADLKDDMGLYFKGSIYSRKTALSRAQNKVGAII